jgi:hypothetical protein
MLDLSARLEAARAEVQALQRNRSSALESDPGWRKHLTW